MGHKVCITCKEDKELSEFSKDANRSDGHGSQCKQCKALAQKARQQGKPHSYRDDKIKTTASKLGLTVPEYVDLRASPCDICDREGSEDDPNSVYTDKQSGEIKGVVCKACARALGHFKYDTKRLERAWVLLN
jgi:hypothetical protein